MDLVSVSATQIRTRRTPDPYGFSHKPTTFSRKNRPTPFSRPQIDCRRFCLRCIRHVRNPTSRCSGIPNTRRLIFSRRTQSTNIVARLVSKTYVLNTEYRVVHAIIERMNSFVAIKWVRIQRRRTSVCRNLEMFSNVSSPNKVLHDGRC